MPAGGGAMNLTVFKERLSKINLFLSLIVLVLSMIDLYLSMKKRK